MAMGIVSDEEFLREQEKLVNIPVSVEIVDIKGPGRGKDVSNVPDEARKIIGEVGIVDRPGALAIASSLGIGKDSVTAYSAGATSCATYNDKDNPLGKHIKNKKSKIVNRATSKLMEALKNIDADRLESAKLSEVSGVARDMSVIIKNMEEGSGDKGNSNVQNNFVLFRPMMKSEDSFETIYSKE